MTIKTPILENITAKMTNTFLKFFVACVLLSSISGCRALSDAVEPDADSPRQDLPAITREQPNLSTETAGIAVDPDADGLIEETQPKPESVNPNSNTAPAISASPNNSSPVAANTNTKDNNPKTYAVTFSSFGNATIGMTIAEASRALGTELVRDKESEDGCYYAESQSLPGVRFMFSSLKIARIDISSDKYITDKGAKVGDTEEKIKELYPRIQVLPQKYDEKKHDMEIISPDEKYLIVFETDGKRVTGFRVGNPEEVGYVEGCS